MKTKTSKFKIPERIIDALKCRPIQRSAFKMLKREALSIERGQIWTPFSQIENGSYKLLIMEKLSSNFVNACPVFIWTEYTGPKDIILPKCYGVRLTISFELESTFKSETILAEAKCIGYLDNKAFSYILEAANKMSEGDKRGLICGPSYIDENDIRYIYHCKILEKIEELQKDAIKDIYAEDNLNMDLAPKLSFAFPVFASVKTLAAKSKQGARRELYSLSSSKDIQITFTESSDKEYVYVNVFKKNLPTKVLDGATIFSSSGTKLGIIKYGNVKISTKVFSDKISIYDSKANPLKFIKGSK